MKKMWQWALMLVLATVLVACGGGDKPKEETGKEESKGESDGYEEARIRLAYNLPQDHHISVGIENFAKEVKERSDGKVNIQVYPAGQLLSDKDMNQSILSGGVEMGMNSSTLWASTVPAMGIFDVPYVFNNYATVGELLQGEFGDILRKEMEAKGAYPLIFADYGYMQFANNKHPLKSPEDFKGLKIRSIGDLPSELIQAYGASPVFMGGGEVYMALQRKTVDGATSGTTAMLQRKYEEVTDYLTINNYAYLEFLLAVNGDFWNGLPEKTRQLLTEVAAETETWIREQAEKEDADSAKQLEEKGMDVYVVPDEELQQWIDASAPVRDVFVQTAGEVGQKLLDLSDQQ